MNISQITLNPQQHTLSSEQNKTWWIGMLGLEVQDKNWSGLLSLPLKLTGHVHSSVRYALRA